MLIEQLLEEIPNDRRFLCFNFDWSGEGCVVDAVLKLPTEKLVGGRK